MKLTDIKIATDAEIKIAEMERLEEIRHKRQSELWTLVPAAFKKTDHSRLDSTALKQVLTWAAQPREATRNLVIAGKTGKGKTRLAWEAIKQRYLQHGGRPQAIGAETFARRMLRETELIDKLSWARLLLLDDIGKERMTSTAESVIFELIRERTDNELPTIYTTNFDPNELKKRFTQEETGAALLRRIMESSHIITMP